MGTLLRLEDPVEPLRAALLARFGVAVGAAEARAAMRAEIGFYRAHMHTGRDPASLARLRERAAQAMRPALGDAVARAPAAALTDALLDALRFTAYPDAAPALRALRVAGHALVVVSNWDASLPERLAETGLAGLLDGAVASAVAGVAKPAPAIFTRALALAGAAPADAWHVGDSVVADVGGARAAGVRPVLVARAGVAGEIPGGAGADEAPPGVPVLRDLSGLPALVAG